MNKDSKNTIQKICDDIEQINLFAVRTQVDVEDTLKRIKILVEEGNKEDAEFEYQELIKRLEAFA